MRRPKKIFIGEGELSSSEKAVSMREVKELRTAKKDDVVFIFRHEDGNDYDMTKEEFDNLVETFRILAEIDRRQNRSSEKVEQSESPKQSRQT